MWHQKCESTWHVYSVLCRELLAECREMLAECREMLAECHEMLTECHEMLAICHEPLRLCNVGKWTFRCQIHVWGFLPTATVCVEHPSRQPIPICRRTPGKSSNIDVQSIFQYEGRVGKKRLANRYVHALAQAQVFRDFIENLACFLRGKFFRDLAQNWRFWLE